MLQRKYCNANMSICPVYGGGNWNGYLIPHTCTRQSVQWTTSTFIEYIHSLSSVESWAGKKLCRIKISPGAKVEFEYEYKKHCGLPRGVPWPGWCYQAINSRGWGRWVVSTPHPACHQPPASTTIRECSFVCDGKCGIENRAWLQCGSTSPFFSILINLLTSVWQATWPRLYILHCTQHTKCWGSKKFISQPPCFAVVDVDSAVLCCVVIVVELNFINWVTAGWATHKPSKPINPATSPARPGQFKWVTSSLLSSHYKYYNIYI